MAKKKNSDTALRRGAARLAAVQAIYQIDIAGSRPDDVISDFLSGAIGGEVIEEDLDLETEDSIRLIELHAELFTILVRGMLGRKERLDEVINTSLGGAWEPERLQPLLRAILRCGLYELMDRPDVPARVVISEYVDMARAFYDGAEPGMVNAVLDRLAKELRPEEMAAPRRGAGGNGTAG